MRFGEVWLNNADGQGGGEGNIQYSMTMIVIFRCCFFWFVCFFFQVKEI